VETPNALIREGSRLDWAVQLDAWGNVRAEHNPGDLYQPIRLPGQHADGETSFITTGIGIMSREQAYI